MVQPESVKESEGDNVVSRKRVDRDLQGDEAEYAMMVEKQGQSK